MQTDEPTPREPWGFSWPQRLALAVLVLVLLAFMMIQYLRRPALLDVAGESQAAGAILPRRIDPNTATAVELTQIPNLAVTLAEKIVAYRDARRDTAADHIVFRRHDDLAKVPGMKPKMLDQVLPFLDFPEEDNATTNPEFK